MKIAISTSVIQRGKTGVAQYVFALVKELRHFAGEHEFTLFVLEEDLPLFEFARTEMKLIPVSEKFRSPLKNIFWHQTELPNLIRKHGIDVLHIPSYRRMLWPQPCALVATIHDLAPFHVAEKYDWKRMFYGRVVAKRLAQRQNKIIAISNNTANDIAHFFQVSREKISVVYNGLDHERFFPASKTEAKQAVAQQHGIRTPFFLYLSRLEHPAKNHIRLIEAFNQFKAETNSEWKLVFGGSDWHGADVIHDAIRRSRFSTEIHSLGFVANADLPQLLRAADVFVYPSLFEGFGLPPIEAMACGTPVISSDRGSLGEVVGNAAILANPQNITDLKQQLTKVANDLPLREKLGEIGIAHAKRFNWKKTAAETISAYFQAIRRENFQPTTALDLADLPLATRK